jgi:putative transposase
LPLSKSTSKTSEKSKTPTFVCELPLRVSPMEEKVLLACLEAARQVYNACLGEALRRLALVRQSKQYNAALRETQEEKRQELFAAARGRYGFKDSVIQHYAVELRRSWISDHLDVHTTQKLASRAYRAVNEYAVSKRGRPRFKGKNQLDSVESKSNKSGIRWRGGCVEWGKLTLPALINSNDPVIEHGLSHPVKYVRLVRRKIRNKNRFYVQLVCEGIPYQKVELGTGTVGMDTGPSTVATVGEDSAILEQFCAELDDKSREIRLLQRRLERQRRANNPENYNADGTIKKGPKKWRNSNRYKEIKAKLAETHRCLAEHRKALHGRLANRILQMGDTFLVEDVSYKSFQRNYGRSVGRRAPGMFISNLCRKAESAGGRGIRFSTKSTKLSQACHCGQYKKKRLSERVHECGCGVIMQRDLYSGYLARFVDPEISLLHAGQAKDAWPGAEPLLRAAWTRAINNQPASRGNQVPSSFGRMSELEQVVRRRRIAEAEARDAVAYPQGDGESPGKAEAFPARTPRL